MPYDAKSRVIWAGVAFAFNAELTLVIPPIALTDLEQLQEKLEAPDAPKGAVNTGTIIDAAHAALRRNYPDITRAEVGALLDAGNRDRVWMALMGVSGLKRTGSGAPGEAAAPSTGASSTPS